MKQYDEVLVPVPDVPPSLIDALISRGDPPWLYMRELSFADRITVSGWVAIIHYVDLFIRDGLPENARYAIATIPHPQLREALTQRLETALPQAVALGRAA